MSVQITDIGGAQIVAPTVLDAKGNPTTFVKATYAVADATLLKLVDNGDGTGSIAAVGPLTPAGSATQLTVTIEGLADGSDNITGSVDVVIVASKAATATINLSNPT